MTLEEVRQFYAEEIRIAAPLRSRAVGEAFARVPREEFLGPGPWQFGNASGASGASCFPANDADPRRVYHNVTTVALDMSRHLCNGQPGTIGRLIDELDIQPGERIFHLGCATGYFTAILAEVTGPGGRVVARELNADLAARAKVNLSRYPNVTVHAASGVELNPGACNAMLINAGVTVPLPGRLDRLSERGRMVVPLTIAMGPPTIGKGMVAKITSHSPRSQVIMALLRHRYSLRSDLFVRGRARSAARTGARESIGNRRAVQGGIRTAGSSRDGRKLHCARSRHLPQQRCHRGHRFPRIVAQIRFLMRGAQKAARAIPLRDRIEDAPWAMAWKRVATVEAQFNDVFGLSSGWRHFSLSKTKTGVDRRASANQLIGGWRSGGVAIRRPARKNKLLIMLDVVPYPA